MSLLRVVYFGFSKNFLAKSSNIFKNDLVSQFQSINLSQIRNFRKAYGAFLRTMQVRRKIIGPDKVRKRSEYFDWNYNAELYAFDKRLHENISQDTLRCVFVHDSYIQMEEQRRKDMDIQEASLNLKPNSDLVTSGEKVMSEFLKRYLRYNYKLMPEEGIIAVHDYLLSEDILSHVSFNIGTSDLILCSEYPPEKQTLANTLKAFVGGIAADCSLSRAETFVLDFICPQLIGKDIFEIWDFDKPLQVLDGILRKKGCALPESRLIFESGRNTIEAIYHIGLYSDKQFLGRGAGETLTFAEEIAAYDALRRIFHLNEFEKPLSLGEASRKIEFKSDNEHYSIKELCGDITEIKQI